MSRLSMCVSAIAWIGVAVLWLLGEIQDKTVIAWAVGWTLGFAWMQRERAVDNYREAERLPSARVVRGGESIGVDRMCLTCGYVHTSEREKLDVERAVDEIAASAIDLNRRSVQSLNELRELIGDKP